MKPDSAIKTYWEKESPAFSSQYRKLFGIPITPVGVFLHLRHQKIRKLLSRLPGKKFVDVGCGSGIYMCDGLLQGRFVYGIDYSPQMLATARQNLSDFPPQNYSLIEADAEKLPLKSEGINIVLASGLTDYLTLKILDNFLKETHRILKKGGFFLVTFPKKESLFAPLRSGIGLLIRKAFLQLPPMENSFSVLEIQEILNGHGFKILEQDEVLFTMRIILSQKI